MSTISLETQIRRFILGKEEEFPDEEMNRRAKETVSDTYVSLITQRAEELVTQHADVSEEDRPPVAKKAALLLDHIAKLDGIKALMNPQPALPERIEVDHIRGPVTRETLNLK